jgi:prepilin-type N-terminal cleavage/methylation domain-containing protein
MRPLSTRVSGFTLIELMIVVVIIGVLGSVAMPILSVNVRRAKSSEAVGNIKTLFQGAVTYYATERYGQGLGGGSGSRCIVAPAGPFPATPTNTKQLYVFSSNPSFSALGFSYIADPVFYSYQIVSVGACNGGPNNTDVYTFQARGDLDGDGTTSLFELAVGSDGNNELARAAGLYIVRELE